ncbi:MAG: YraN family protein [Candidatus Latescibacterota bacterium]
MERHTRSTGVLGEEAACNYLANKGYRIVTRNYYGYGCEIDIIAESGDTMIFCEVKTAFSPKFGSPVTWVTPKKIRHIARAATEYIVSHGISERSFRFDIIGLTAVDGRFEITHIENAFIAPVNL